VEAAGGFFGNSGLEGFSYGHNRYSRNVMYLNKPNYSGYLLTNVICNFWVAFTLTYFLVTAIKCEKIELEALKESLKKWHRIKQWEKYGGVSYHSSLKDY